MQQATIVRIEKIIQSCINQEQLNVCRSWLERIELPDIVRANLRVKAGKKNLEIFNLGDERKLSV